MSVTSGVTRPRRASHVLAHPAAPDELTRIPERDPRRARSSACARSSPRWPGEGHGAERVLLFWPIRYTQHLAAADLPDPPTRPRGHVLLRPRCREPNSSTSCAPPGRRCPARYHRPRRWQLPHGVIVLLLDLVRRAPRRDHRRLRPARPATSPPLSRTSSPTTGGAAAWRWTARWSSWPAPGAPRRASWGCLLAAAPPRRDRRRAGCRGAPDRAPCRIGRAPAG